MNDLAIAGDHSAAEALQEGRLADPFSYLGLHETTRGTVARAFLPGALGVDVFVRDGGEWLGRLQQVEHTGLFVGPLSRRTDYLLRIEWPQSLQETEDPYAFGPILGDKGPSNLRDATIPDQQGLAPTLVSVGLRNGMPRSSRGCSTDQ